MKNRIELLEKLLIQAENIDYNNNQLDIVLQRADMLIRKIFGDSHYLNKLHAIRFSPSISSTSSTESYFVKSFNRGRDALINLLIVIKEDLMIENLDNDDLEDDAITQPVNNSYKVFIVHGHDEEIKQSVARSVEALGLEAIILHEKADEGKTIIEKFEKHSDVGYAIILLTPDDLAYPSNQSHENAKYRARQNVILELGYFTGKLSRDNVMVIFRKTDNFEIPSDFAGVIYTPYDNSESWKIKLCKELKSAGYDVDAIKLL